MNTCDVCDKTFKRRDNMLRHKRNTHSEIQDSDTDQSMDMSLQPSSDTGESDSEEKDLRYDPWDSLIDKTFEQCREEFEGAVSKLTRSSSLDETQARHRAYEDLRATYRKALVQILTNRMMWFHAMQKDPIYKSMRKTAKDLMDIDDFSREEAWKCAISKRKYLLDSILKDFDPPTVDTNINCEM